MKILLFGGSGNLGKELLKINPGIIAPTREECDITLPWQAHNIIERIRPDIVINSAAETSSIKVDNNPAQAIKTNIIASGDIAMSCMIHNMRLIYISTDYIYKGDRGNYMETDEILPFNNYAWTKLGGECSTRMVKDHLIIRTSFGKSEFEHPFAYDDKIVSKDYVDIIAPMIYEALISNLIGVINIATEPKTIYEYAKKRNPNVHPISIIKNTIFNTPKDTSLNLDKWNNWKNKNNG